MKIVMELLGNNFSLQPLWGLVSAYSGEDHCVVIGGRKDNGSPYGSYVTSNQGGSLELIRNF